MRYRYEYKTETFKIDLGSDETFDDVLNKFGRDGWEAYSVEKYYDPQLSIINHQIHNVNTYTVRLKRLYLN